LIFFQKLGNETIFIIHCSAKVITKILNKCRMAVRLGEWLDVLGFEGHCIHNAVRKPFCS